jgi:diguanylate cyclase (GGDEF)-like protein
LAVAVIDARVRLVFWNEQAADLFGVPGLMAAERPALNAILAKMSGLTDSQRERIVAFGSDHTAAGRNADSGSCLRLSLGRGQRIAIQVHRLEPGRWMLTIDTGRMIAASCPEAPNAGDAWLDALTGLANRRHFNQILRETLDGPRSAARRAVLLIGLDRFAPINERLGRPVGDALLCLVAQRLRRETREDDLLVRMGGDVFVILIPNGEGAEPLAARTIDILSRPFLVEGHLITIGASIGIARLPDEGTSAEVLMRHADLALQAAKADGGGVWRRFEATVATGARVHQALDLIRGPQVPAENVVRAGEARETGVGHSGRAASAANAGRVRGQASRSSGMAEVDQRHGRGQDRVGVTE